MLLRDIRHISKDYRKGDGEDAGHGDDGKVPPERTNAFRLLTVTFHTCEVYNVMGNCRVVVYSVLSLITILHRPPISKGKVFRWSCC